MAWQPGDMNRDGRVDYVDQKIFDTQMNPYSGEFQGESVSRETGEAIGRIVAFFILGFIILFVITLISENLDFLPQFSGLILVAVLPWKKLKGMEFALKKPWFGIVFGALLALLIFKILRNAAFDDEDFYREDLGIVLALIMFFWSQGKNNSSLIAGLCLALGFYLSGRVRLLIIFFRMLAAGYFNMLSLITNLVIIAAFVFILLSAILRRVKWLPFAALACSLFFVVRNYTNPFSYFMLITAIGLLCSNELCMNMFKKKNG